MGFPVVHSKKKSKIWRRGYMTASTGGRSLSTAHTNHPPLVCVSIVVNVELCHLKAAFSASYAAPDPLWVRTRMVLVYKYSAFIVFFLFLLSYIFTQHLGRTDLFFQLERLRPTFCSPESTASSGLSPQSERKLQSRPSILLFSE